MFKKLVATALLFVIASASANAKEALLYSLEGDFAQGGMVIGKTSPETSVYFDDKKIDVTDDGYFVFGFHRDFPKTASLVLKKNGKVEKQPLAIRQREYNIERIDGLPSGKINPMKPETLARIKKEGAMVGVARAKKSKQLAFMQDFIWPSKGRISGVYGSQRVLNGVPKRPHYGIDIAAPTGTAVISPADGIVRLVHNDMFYSGGTLIVDHGYGISSTFIHLHSIDVKEGQKVKQGELIATVGGTGRATGPHLDWRINWYKSRLDPQLVVPPFVKTTFKKK